MPAQFLLLVVNRYTQDLDEKLLGSKFAIYWLTTNSLQVRNKPAFDSQNVLNTVKSKTRWIPSADASADVDGRDAIVEPPWMDLRRVADVSAHKRAAGY
ncbi:hypothetical protein DB48_19550 [Shewanella sp. cp20]|nr:hypothetical protein DB48_19550 [Shewanella sp. cp20]